MQNDLKFSGSSPVTINYNGSPDDIYAPVRTSSCDVNIVSPKILDDLYSAKKNEICIRVKKGNTTIWEGYKMPNTYSQEVTLNLDSIEMTCIDPVSILKYVTIDKLIDKPRILTYKDLIGKCIAYVMLDTNKLWVERFVSYNGGNDMLALQCQTANFWDESDKPATAYQVLEELLRPFCMTLVYEAGAYQIYSVNKISGTRYFDKYTVNTNGTMTLNSSNQSETRSLGLYSFSNDDWKSNNTQTPTIEINNTYDKVTGTCSTSIPSYSKMAMDLVDYTQRNLYDANWFNVQKNKTKGYVKSGTSAAIDSNDHWFYVWNGVYTNPDYGLRDNGLLVNWYLNCNKAYAYLTGNEGHPYNWGSILNFYGGGDNPSGTGKTQAQEKSVHIHKKITVYAPDNGTPPEFLETADLAWNVPTGHYLNKTDISSAKFGENRDMGTSNRVVYHQTYENVNMSSTDELVLELDINQSYSRTGINVDMDIMNNNTATNCTYSLGNLTSCNSNYYPPVWNSSNVVVNSIYFRKYSERSNIYVTPVWDKRRIDMYIQLTNNTVMQFNGKEWVADSSPNVNNSFYLMRLLNNEHLFNTTFSYNVIQTSDGSQYTLSDEPYTYYTNGDGEVVTSGGTENTIQVYRDSVAGPISDSSDGSLSIILPYVNDPGAIIYVDVYNSTILDMTGSSDIGSAGPVPFFYPSSNGQTVKSVDDMWCQQLPLNLTHVKAEHLDLTIKVTAPESNLGQMFSESDIQYWIDKDADYVEEFSGPSFQVNTYNQLVASSWSYILSGNSVADPNLFVLNSITARPECYTVQAYMNWLSTIRKIYIKTLVPEGGRTRTFSNIRTYITSPETGNNELLVVKDSWDVKTNRHTVTAVEDNGLQVSTVSTVNAVEVPRRARAERWNLPTAQK